MRQVSKTRAALLAEMCCISLRGLVSRRVNEGGTADEVCPCKRTGFFFYRSSSVPTLLPRARGAAQSIKRKEDHHGKRKDPGEAPVVTQEKKGMTPGTCCSSAFCWLAGAVLKFFVGSLFNVGMSPTSSLPCTASSSFWSGPGSTRPPSSASWPRGVPVLPGQPYLNSSASWWARWS